MFAGTLKTLGDCENTLLSACTVPNLPGNFTTDSLDECRNSASQFRKDYDACTKILDGSVRCDCILNNITAIDSSKCSISVINEVYDKIVDIRLACLTGDK